MNTPFAPWLGVFETLKVTDGKPHFFNEHLIELRRSAAALGLAVDEAIPRAATSELQGSGRWRWIVTPQGTHTLFTPEAWSETPTLALSISPLRLGSQNWDARFKTLSYLTHAQALTIAPTPEVVLLNERGEVASAARANLFWRRGTRYFTPAHEVGCRCGVVRGLVLNGWPVEQGAFPLDDLLTADEIFLTNSIRGVVSVASIEGRAYSDSPWADEVRLKF